MEGEGTLDFLVAQLLYKQIYVTDSLTNVQLLRPYLRFVDRFGRNLWFCHLKFDKEAISDGFMAHFRVFLRGRGVELRDFRELCFCGICGPCFYINYTFFLYICSKLWGLFSNIEWSKKLIHIMYIYYLIHLFKTKRNCNLYQR